MRIWKRADNFIISEGRGDSERFFVLFENLIPLWTSDIDLAGTFNSYEEAKSVLKQLKGLDQ